MAVPYPAFGSGIMTDENVDPFTGHRSLRGSNQFASGMSNGFQPLSKAPPPTASTTIFGRRPLTDVTGYYQQSQEPSCQTTLPRFGPSAPAPQSQSQVPVPQAPSQPAALGFAQPRVNSLRKMR